MLGVISDMSFHVKGEKERLAGKRLGEWIRTKDTYIPIIFTSSESNNREQIKGISDVFIDKNSKTFPQDLRRSIKENLGFGDFIITDPHTKEEIFRIRNLKELQMNIRNIPDDALFTISPKPFSRFFSRAMFPVAEMLKKIDVSEYASMHDARELIHATIVQYRRMKNTGVVAVFEKERFDQYSTSPASARGRWRKRERSRLYRLHGEDPPGAEQQPQFSGHHPQDGGALYRPLRRVHGGEQPLPGGSLRT